MEKRHYITALFLLLLPVVVIYSLTSYGIEEPALNEADGIEQSSRAAYTCQQKQGTEKGSKAVGTKATGSRLLK